MFRTWLAYFTYFNITIGLALWLSTSSFAVDSDQLGNHTFIPCEDDFGDFFEGSDKVLHVLLPYCELNYTSFTAYFTVSDVAIISNITHMRPFEHENFTCHNAIITLTGKRLGETKLVFKSTYSNVDPNDPCSKEVEIENTYRLVVQRPPLIEKQIFTLGTAAFLVILNLGFGCSLNLGVVKEILKKPIAPGVGFCCQYVMMPLIGFAVAMTLLRDDPLFAFGLICSSCSPGGAGSNVWCLLLGGDVSLSLTMTFFSLSASLGMMPLWLFLLGRFFIDTSTIKIPYLDIMANLCLFVVPCFIGVIFRKLKQPWAEKVGKAIKPVALLFLAFLLTFGLYTNRYIYAQIAKSPYIIPPALLQPYFGFGVGFLVARYIARQPKYRCITIAIETGVQNVTIPMVLLQGSFKQPYGDLAAVMPVTTAHFTPVPMIGALLGVTIYNLYKKKKGEKDNPEGGVDENDGGTKKEIGGVDGEHDIVLKGDVNVSPREIVPLKNGHSWERMQTDWVYSDKDAKFPGEEHGLLNGIAKADIEKTMMSLDRESVI